jgi:hypothetical protein
MPAEPGRSEQPDVIDALLADERIGAPIAIADGGLLRLEGQRERAYRG